MYVHTKYIFVTGGVTSSLGKGIFSAYNPKKAIGYKVNVDDEDGNRLFPIHKPAHPKSLVHYVDLAPHRKKKLF